VRRGATCPSATAAAQQFAPIASCDGRRRGVEPADGAQRRRARRSNPADRQYLRSRPSVGCGGQKGGRSLSRPITLPAHDQDPRVVDAKGNPIRPGVAAGKRMTARSQIRCSTTLARVSLRRPRRPTMPTAAADRSRTRASLRPKRNRRRKPHFGKGLYRAQPDRAVLLQAEALSPRRHPL